MPPVYLGYIDDSEFNAFALDSRECGFIGMNMGVFERLRSIFVRMEVLRWPMSYLVPADTRSCIGAQRSAFRLYLGSMFLVLHELAHIRRGHSGMIHGSSGSGFMLEFDNDRRHGLTALEWQTLEYDADCWAATASCSLLGLFASEDPDLFEISKWGYHEDRIASVLDQLVIVLHVVFSACDTSVVVGDLDHDHPSPALRLLVCMRVITSVLCKQAGFSPPAVAYVQAKATDRILTSFGAIKVGVCAFTETFDPTWNRAAEEHLERLNETWKALWPRLDPFSHSDDIRSA